MVVVHKKLDFRLAVGIRVRNGWWRTPLGVVCVWTLLVITKSLARNGRQRKE